MSKNEWFTGAVMVSGLVLYGVTAEAFGPKPPNPTPTAPPLTTPFPYYDVGARSVGAQAFGLPNGSQVNQTDFSASLDDFFQTAVVQNSRFRPHSVGSEGTPSSGGPEVGPSVPAPEGDTCGDHLEVWPVVSSLELNIASLGISFGYDTSSNPLVPGNSVTGKVDVTISNAQMDIALAYCHPSFPNCDVIDSVKADQNTAGVTGNITIDFSSVKTALDFLYKTDMANVLRTIMADGMGRLGKTTKIPTSVWRGIVQQVNDPATFIFTPGTDEGIDVNQTFQVYAQVPVSSGCGIFDPVANVHTIQAGGPSSTAIVDSTLDSRGVKPGDVVLVRDAPATPASGK